MSARPARRTPTPRLARAVAVALLGLAAFAGTAREAPARGGEAARPAHVVLVILGGGVRAQDMLDAKLMPELAALAGEGRVVDKLESGAKDGYAAAARLLTGRDDGLDGAGLLRPPAPTLWEYVRHARSLPADAVWFVSHKGGDALNLAASTHERYGRVLGPSVAYGMGAFATPLHGFLEKFGRPVPVEPESWSQLRRLRLLSRQQMSVWLPQDVDAGLPRSEAVERALLREIGSKALLVEGPGERDQRALRAARTVLEVHRPSLLVVWLGDAEQAAVSLETYRAVLRANDAGIRRLREAVAADKAMAGHAAFVVVADRGRNEKPDAQGALAEGDGSRSSAQVALVAHGPGILRRGAVKGARRIEDVCPTVARLLGAEAPHATGRPWAGLVGE